MKLVIDTKLDDFKIRFAERNDVSLILEFIKELADYEKMLHEVVATEEILTESLFNRKMAEVIIGEYQNKPVAFGFKNVRDGHFIEVMVIKTPEDLGRFKSIYGITEIKKEY